MLGLDAVVTEIKHFYADTAYNAVIIDRIREAMAGADAAAFELVFSAHGLPQKIVDGRNNFV